MTTVTIGSNTYPVYADIAYASTYLAADIARASGWASLAAAPDTQRMALVSATRILQRMPGWASGAAPDLVAPPSAVMDATSIIAADLAQKPKLSKSTGTGSNVKRVRAGSVETEFFRQTPGEITPIPGDAFDVLLAAGLVQRGGDDAVPEYSGGDVTTRFTYDNPDCA